MSRRLVAVPEHTLQAAASSDLTAEAQRRYDLAAVIEAQRQVLRLASAMLLAPFDTEVLTDLRVYLDHHGPRARGAAERLGLTALTVDDAEAWPAPNDLREPDDASTVSWIDDALTHTSRGRVAVAGESR